MGFTADGQLRQNESAARDAEFGVNTSAIAAHRATVIKPVQPLAEADSWENGYCVQLALANCTCH